jgi:hypothetical protein
MRTRITAYKIVSGIFSGDKRMSMDRAARAQKERTATTNQTNVRLNPIKHLATNPRVGCGCTAVVFTGRSAGTT